MPYSLSTDYKIHDLEMNSNGHFTLNYLVKFLRELYLMIIIYLQVMGMTSCGQEVNAMVAVDTLM